MYKTKIYYNDKLHNSDEPIKFANELFKLCNYANIYI